jgi:hypothetical protein
MSIGNINCLASEAVLTVSKELDIPISLSQSRVMAGRC